MGDWRALLQSKYLFFDVINIWLIRFCEQLRQYVRRQLVMGICYLPLGFGEFTKILGFLSYIYYDCFDFECLPGPGGRC